MGALRSLRSFEHRASFTALLGRSTSLDITISEITIPTSIDIKGVQTWL
jgi:hypothetical protein